MAIKTSKVMQAALEAFAQNGGWVTFSGYEGRMITSGTRAALMDRGLIEYGLKDEGTNGYRTMGHYLSEAGWAYLGLERPQHAGGRYTLAEALEAAYTSAYTAVEASTKASTDDLVTRREAKQNKALAWFASPCKGCTGTCCTGVGSDPCTCPDDSDDEDEPVTQKPVTLGTHTIAAEDFTPGYRYWPVREGFESNWTIKSVTVAEGENQVYRDGKWVTPLIVTHVRRDGTTRNFYLGEQVAVQGITKTDN